LLARFLNKTADSPTALRLLARFLNKTADDIQNGSLRNSHIHIGSAFPEWKEIGGDVDVIRECNDAFENAE
jgi:hypothetical protein